MTPSRVPQFETIIRNFLSKRDPIDRNKPSDYGIDKVLKLDLFDDSFINLKKICEELSWDIPSKDKLDQLLVKVKEDTEPIKYTSVKILKPRYYAIHINDDIISFLDSVFLDRPDDLPFWKHAKAHIPLEKVFHVTLGVKNVHKPEYSFYQKNQEEFNGKKIDVCVARVVWDSKAIAIHVKLPDNVKCGNQYPHITIATLQDSVESSYSNTLLESNPMTQLEVQDKTLCGEIEPFY